MKYLVTGATGYVGAHLVKALINHGHTVNALCRSKEKAALIQQVGVTLCYGDILNKKSVDTAAVGCDGIFHLAAYAKVWAKNPKTYFDLNVTGTENVLQSAIKGNIKKVVVTSTAGVFGTSNGEAITESYVRNRDFFNEYESSKTYCESRIKNYVIAGLDVVIVNPTRIYGPYLFGSPDSVTRLIVTYINGIGALIPGKGDKIGNYVFIDDVVDGHISAMQKGAAGQTYILGGENSDYINFFSILRTVSGKKKMMIKIPFWLSTIIANIQLFLANVFGKTPLITPKWLVKGKYDWEVSAQRAVNELGLEITSLTTGLQKTVEWLNQNYIRKR
ncbi:MAG: NAD-dependent epimerase/dehydratase family protein [Bacteroidetes bacterium]|nr:NAD-dependent epimerase/dehydratase family protein [Bacteroidota bacterium]